MCFREIIVEEAKRQGLGTWRLAKLASPHVSVRMLQRYFRGKSDMTGAKLAVVCRILGIELKAKQDGRRSHG